MNHLPPTDDAIVYRGNTIIYEAKIKGYGSRVFVKRPASKHPSKQEIAALENEHDLAYPISCRSVRKVLGIEKSDGELLLVLQPINGHTLRDHLDGNQLDFNHRLQLATAVVRSVHDLHTHAIVHNELSATNLLVSDTDHHSIVVIDLGSAVRNTSSCSRSGGSLKNECLPYLPPERLTQGKIFADFRIDLYSTGVVLYEIMTGRPPFLSEDPQTLIHEHLALTPDEPSRFDIEIPDAIDRIILKLLAKDPDERYQSAYGLLMDLEKCLHQLHANGDVLPFSLAEFDHPAALHVPDKLYGRAEQINRLRSLIDATLDTPPNMIIVQGFAGVGKTALVQQLREPTVQKGGLFLQGKAEQYHANTPYTAIRSSFGELVPFALGRPERELEKWREEISTAVGDQGAVLFDIVHGLDQIVGRQAKIISIGGEELRNRFNYIMGKFIGALLRLARPVILFLDDLQWIDEASLDLLKAVLSDADQTGFCAIGAFRESEVCDTHPITGFLREIESGGIELATMTLENLDFECVSAMISETLGPTHEIGKLCSLLFEKTLGNPFFTKQILYSIYDQDLIRFKTDSKQWEWLPEELQALNISENVIEYLVSTIAQLDPTVQNVLKLASCVGTQFNPILLSALTGKTLEEVIRELHKPQALQLLRREDHSYRFVHDRIQQAIYGLIEQEERFRIHLRIGRELLQIPPEEQLEESLFEIVDHFYIAEPLIEDRNERLRIARLNLRAGEKARGSAAFSAMLRYINQGINLLASDSWRSEYDLTLQLHTKQLEAEYLNTNFERAAAGAESILKYARSVLDQIRIYEILMMSNFARYRMQEAIEVGREVLSKLGITMINEPPPLPEIEHFRRLSTMTDPHSVSAMKILTHLFPPAMIAAPKLLPKVIFTSIELCLQKGNSEYSAFAYALFGMYLCREPAGIEMGNRFGQLALETLETSESRETDLRVEEIVHSFIDSWGKKHLREATADMNRIVQSAMESGQVEIASNELMSMCILLVVVAEPLWSARKLSAEYVRTIAKLKQGFQLKLTSIWAQLLLNLSGLAQDPAKLTGPYCDEDKILPQLEQEHGLTSFYSSLAIAILCFFVGDYRKCLEYTSKSTDRMPELFGFPVAATHSTFHALAMLQLYPEAGEEQQKKYLRELKPIRSRMKAIADQGSVNFTQDFYLVEAETAAVIGETARAFQLYEKAIRTSRNNRYPNYEAISCELASRFYMRQGLVGPAEYYISQAYTLYSDWGLEIKLRELEAQHPDLALADDRKPEWDSRLEEHTLTEGRPVLDSALKAMRALSSETELKTLLSRMMDIVMEHAGAERAVVLLKQKGQWYIQATGDFQQNTYEVMLNLPLSPGPTSRCDAPVPTSVVNLCLHSGQSYSTTDARNDKRFSSDPYIKHKNVRSILCLPLRYQGRMNGVLYLENRSTPAVFEHAKVELLELLGTQFSISFENALLYEESVEKLRFERLISQLSAGFVNLPAHQIDRQLADGMKRLVSFLHVDQGIVYEYSNNNETLVLKHASAKNDVLQPALALYKLHCYRQMIEGGRTIIVRQIQELPAEIEETKHCFRQYGIRSYIAVPMSVGGLSLGFIEFASFHRENQWSTEIVDRLRLIEEIFAQALKRRMNEQALQRRTAELKETANRLKNLSEHLQEVREQERANIAREIHDELGQALTVLRMDTSWIGRHLETDPALIADRLDDMISLIDAATATVQDICRELRPHMLDMLGLFDAIEWQVKEFQGREDIACRVTCSGQEPKEERYVIVLFRIVQEALTNVSRHANASEVRVNLDVCEKTIFLEIADNGRGISPENLSDKHALGLIGMRERISFLDGKLDISSPGGKGTRLLVTLPLKESP